MLPVGVEAGAGFHSYDSETYHLDASLGTLFSSGSNEIGFGYEYRRDRASNRSVSKNLAYTRIFVPPLTSSIKAGQRKEDASTIFGEALIQFKLPVDIFWGFSVYLEPSAAAVLSGDSLFASELVSVGGSRTLRGYSEDQFRTDLGTWSRQEIRWGSSAFYLYPLFDAGWIADHGFLASYGAGVSILSPIGRFTLDSALPLEGSFNQIKLHLILDSEF
jgi:outer membrane protein assembly factor BamA